MINAMADIKKGNGPGRGKFDNSNKGGCVEKSLKHEVALYKVKLLVIGGNTLEKRNRKLGKMLNLAKAWGPADIINQHIWAR